MLERGNNIGELTLEMLRMIKILIGRRPSDVRTVRTVKNCKLGGAPNSLKKLLQYLSNFSFLSNLTGII